MVTRCGFFLMDNKICRQDVKIDWTLGFTREAKVIYIQNLAQALKSKGIGDVMDITTASSGVARRCSPVFLKSAQNPEMAVDDFYGFLKKQFGEIGAYPPHGTFSYLYACALEQDMNAKMRDCILGGNCFTDVFFNPEKQYNTQAKSAVEYQYLKRNNTDEEVKRILENLESYSEWYKELEGNIVVLS